MAATTNSPTGPGLRRWFVAGAIIEQGKQILFVENLRRNGSTDWSTPGGVVESGEDTVDGLAREVNEETGLQVSQWSTPLYTVEVVAAGLGWHLTVQVFRAVQWSGHVSVGSDPDGIVVNARFLTVAEAESMLESNAVWVREPILTWAQDQWTDHRAFRYELHGADRASVTVTRK